MERRPCGCNGVRTCLLCEPIETQDSLSALTIVQCRVCGRFLTRRPDSAKEELLRCAPPPPCTPSSVSTPTLNHCQSELGALPKGLGFNGVTVIRDFIGEEEERELVTRIDQSQWVRSQSGRCKQDYGPKVNFKRQKVKIGCFNGLPPFSQSLVTRMRYRVEGMEDFIPVEVCNLDYRPERGAAIDPHIDDTWVWGKRLVTLNLLSDTTLTFSLPQGQPSPIHIQIFMPRRSLVIVAGCARYQWQHSIQRGHVTSRRVAVTIRELSHTFLPGGADYIPAGKDILERAAGFNGCQTNKLAI